MDRGIIERIGLLGKLVSRKKGKWKRSSIQKIDIFNQFPDLISKDASVLLHGIFRNLKSQPSDQVLYPEQEGLTE